MFLTKLDFEINTSQPANRILDCSLFVILVLVPITDIFSLLSSATSPIEENTPSSMSTIANRIDSGNKFGSEFSSLN